MLDTNVCIGLLRGGRRSGARWIRRHDLDELCLSAITLAELSYGVYKSKDPAANEQAVMEFCVALEIARFDGDAAETYGRIRAGLESDGQSIGPLDTLIAAHALSRDLVLVTNNEREFRRVVGLQVENWSPI
jgi:tRNA(fMet)-specific endonuclease VapC